ncbi:MAG: deoxyguanosinetriphosphate triphosphohydrolase [Clostridia bacterium]
MENETNDKEIKLGVREYLEETERKNLSSYAMLSKNTRGRDYELEKCPVRTEFMRDRDRIIHCKSFRRLMHKTQVFMNPFGDHYRTRLTHSLEVSQIARTIARGLRLNEDLTEAIALGHDLGHPPFGHAGEAVLNALVPTGFAHNSQSLRIVEKLENGVGLNLTYEVRDGILNHRQSTRPITMEGQVVRLSDKIAYINHDIDDAIRAGVLSIDDIPKSAMDALGKTQSERINTLICDCLNTSDGKDKINLSPAVFKEYEILLGFLYQSLYLSSAAKKDAAMAGEMLTLLYEHYLKNIDFLPIEFLKNADADGKERVTADYIACMTDRFAINDFNMRLNIK